MWKWMKLTNPANLIWLFGHLVLIASGFAIIGWFEQTPIQAVGASFVATGGAGCVLYLYVRASDNLRERIEIVTRYGFVDVFPARQTRIKGEYDARLDVASHNIDILAFGLASFREDYGDRLAELKARADIRILLIDPAYPTPEHGYAQQRDKEEGNSANVIDRNVKDFLKACTEIVDNRLQIKLYTCLPSVNIFRIDDELFWGPYLIGKPSRNMPTFIVRRGGIIFDVLLEHFDDIWSNDQFSQSADIPDAG